MQATEIKHCIETHLSNCTAIVSGEDGVHFTATVISPDFAGKTRIAAQKMVYAAINTYLNNGSLHAISLTTYTPEEWHAKHG